MISRTLKRFTHDLHTIYTWQLQTLNKAPLVWQPGFNSVFHHRKVVMLQAPFHYNRCTGWTKKKTPTNTSWDIVRLLSMTALYRGKCLQVNKLKLIPLILTSITIVAIKRVGSNILFNCFIGPIRKRVLRKQTNTMNIRQRQKWQSDISKIPD